MRAVIVTLLRRHLGRTLVVAALFLMAAALGLVMPASLGRIVDAVSTTAGLGTIALWVACVAAGAIAAAGVSLVGTRLLTSLVQDCLASLREDVFGSAMRLPVGAVDDGESSDLLSRVTGDVDAVAEAGGNVVPVMLSATFTIVVSLAALTALDPWLALAGIACVPFYALGTRAFLRRSRVVFREVREREAHRSQAVIEAVEGAETITALNEHEHALGRVRTRAEASIRVQIEGVRIRNRLFRWINGGEAVGLGAILAVGFMLHAGDLITIGMVTTAALVFHRLFDPIGQLIFGLDDIQRAAIGLARLVGVIEFARDHDDHNNRVRVGHGVPHSDSGAVAVGPLTLATQRAAIAAHGVCFRYPTTGRGIDGVSITVDPGATVAFVGSSGSGKSTLARIIAGQYAPDSGELVISPAGVHPYYISQELHQFRGGIAENLRLVAPDATDDQLVDAVRAVGADWAVAAIRAEAGEQTGARDDEPLDEGRIQQLAIARAVLADPAIVILDEATADVGLQHRDAVESAIDELSCGRTTVVIAHRLEQAASADRIMVFDAGTLIEQGSYAELVAADGPYRTFWIAQHGERSAPQSETEHS